MRIPPILANWKSTCQAILSAIIGLSAVAPQISLLDAHQAAILVSAGVVAKVFIGILQQDAGSTLAYVRGSKTPVVVDSHETPDDSKAIPVPEATK
jgi:hypothetical protein